MRKILIVSYSFPPLASSAVFRPLKFVKFLREFDWEPVVLTVREGRGFFGITDTGLNRDVPHGTAIHRAWEPFSKSNQPLGELLQPKEARSIETIKKWVKNWLVIPDAKILWAFSAVVLGWRVLRKNRCDVILSTSSYYSNHIVGYFLHKATGLPWIADFQDPWTDNPYRVWPGRLRRWLERFLERRVVKAARLVTTTTDALTRQLSAKVPEAQNKFQTITNGFDPEDLREGEAKVGGPFVLLHAGSLYQKRQVLPFLRVFGEWMQAKPDRAMDMSLVFLGSVSPEDKKAMKDILHRYRLEHSVRFVPVMPYRVGLEMMREADGLMLVTDQEEGGRDLVPTKLYEYLSLKKPILALTPEKGECANLLRKFSQKLIVDQNNPDTVWEALDTLAYGPKNGQNPAPDLEPYHWKTLTKRLAALLEGLK